MRRRLTRTGYICFVGTNSQPRLVRWRGRRLGSLGGRRRADLRVIVLRWVSSAVGVGAVIGLAQGGQACLSGISAFGWSSGIDVHGPMPSAPVLARRVPRYDA